MYELSTHVEKRFVYKKNIRFRIVLKIVYSFFTFNQTKKITLICQRRFRISTSQNSSEIDEKFFVVDAFCSNNDDTSITKFFEIYKPMNLDDQYLDHSQTKSDTQILPYKSRSWKSQSFIRVRELTDLPDIDTDTDAV